MARLLSNEELKKELTILYSRNTVLKESTQKRKHNIDAFNKIDRKKLKYNKTEYRLLLYETLQGEKVHIQYPGKESEDTMKKPNDFRPKLQFSDGSGFMQDASFGFIWDILDEIGKSRKVDLDFVSAIFLRMGYMYGYEKVSESVIRERLKIKKETIESVERCEDELLEWYKISLSDDAWYTLNDKIGPIKVSEDGHCISFEALIKFVDLLFQNEDCKYYYINVVVNNQKDYNLANGRLNSSTANLCILNYLEGNDKLSNLLNAFQKSRGVPSFKKADYAIVTNGIVKNIDLISRDE